MSQCRVLLDVSCLDWSRPVLRAGVAGRTDEKTRPPIKREEEREKKKGGKSKSRVRKGAGASR